MLDDLSKSIKAQLYERVSSPLLASFGISWLAWNYRFVLALISSLPFNEKLAFIDTQIFPTYERVLLQGGLYPLATALLLIFVYPIPAKFVYEYWKKRQKELKEVQQRIDDETPMSHEEAREIRREALQASLEFDKEIQTKSAEIARLKELIEELQQVGASKPVQVPISIEPVLPSQADEIDDAQAAMLDEVARASDGINKAVLLERTPGDKILAEYNLGELKRLDLVTITYSAGGRYTVKVTHEGRALLVKREKLGDARLQ